MRKAINLAVIENKKILLVKKNETWILPGGKPNYPEERDECVLFREFEEELPKTNIEILNYYKSFIGKTPYKGDELEAKVYFGRVNNLGNPSSEISDVKYINYFSEYTLSDITIKIVNSLKRDNYL
jgi:8-oxo-dGTP pyrophosphatase MutT (NUDIX family)